ncbi:MAG: branched-chain amino acid ABC transporter permease [Candidatus Hydrothermarchaeota archaeon]
MPNNKFFGPFIVFLFLLPFFLGFDDYYLYLLNMAFLFAFLALSWSILGYSGQISFGHAAFFGLGAYTSALLSLKAGITPWIGLFFAGLVAMLFSTIIGLTCFRLRGPYFSLATLAFVEVPRMVTLNSKITNGSLGLIGIPPFSNIKIFSITIDFYASRTATYYFLIILLLLLIFLTQMMIKSRLGFAFSAIREGEETAEVLGVNAFKYKLIALLISSFLTGVCGAIYAHTVHYIEPEIVYGLSFSAIPLVMSMFGGMLSVTGPVIGAIVLYLTNELIFHPISTTAHELMYGLVIVIVILFMPKGIVGWLEERRGVVHDT